MTNDSTPPSTEAELTAPAFYVVGIGASAGGLAALRALFSHMPAEPGVAFVVIVHLSPGHESHLVELLQPCTQMPVCQVRETVALQPNHVYVIPPNANLNTIDTHLRLSQLEARRIERAPIDHFLRTLAATHHGCAVGIILTGAGSDGALGLRQIKENGGLTAVQDPVEAEFDGMPRSALATGMVDIVAPLREMACEIVRFCATNPRLPVPDGEDGIGTSDSKILEQIVDELRTRTGHDFALFRRATILRRMRTRMRLRHSETLRAYLETLRATSDEAKALCRDLLLTVTEFFAEPQLFDHLASEVLPALFARKRNRGDRLRIWSVGCSTGEEAYSLAMLLLERAERREPYPILQVFATDLVDQVLQTAREGIYPHEVAASVSARRLEHFFVQEGGHYRVRREVRDIVVFAAHDLFKDPPYAHLDLIVCRNLLSDLQPAVRRGVLSLFYYALEAHGTLIVGPRDEISEPDLFVRDEHAAGTYRRTVGREPVLVLPPLMGPGPFGRRDDRDMRAVLPQSSARYAAAIFQLAMASYTPASVLIDGENQIIHYSAGAGRYIRIPGGELTQDLLQLVREPIHSRLAPVLEVVRRDRKPWRSVPFPIAIEGGYRRIALRVEPLPVAESPGWLLVVFDEKPAIKEVSLEEQNHVAGIVLRLQAELDRTNQRLRAMLQTQEESEAAQAASEAAQAANDDLRVIVEELQSSREELQAVNEELITLDSENRQRLGQLTQISADLSHLLESTGIATLFIDCDLRIVRFTPQLAGIFNIRHTDIGRPLADLTNVLHYEELEADARRVLADLSAVDREVAGAADRWYLSRMLPYRATAQRVEGVVLTLIDITERRHAENRLREADRRKDEFLAMLAHELRNPLAPISSGIEILRQASGDRQTVERMSAMMARQTQQLIRLVDDLLEVSRISGGKLRLHKEPVPLKSIIHDAITAARPLLDSLTHSLTVTEPPEPVVVDADAVRLTQVIANLLNNAARYTPRGGRIEVIVEPHENSVVVTVKDNGVGIEAEAISHVFDMFYQGGGARVAPAAGLGIGLALAKSLVELHGGTISVVSRGTQCGSEFKVRLPTTTSVPSSDIAATGGPASGINGGRRVLIVDDNSDAAESLCTLIKTLGDTDVHTAANGEEALRRATELHPEVILLDLLMPDMDGFEVARRIRTEPWGKDVTIVALTGWGLEEHRRRSKEAGFDAHLTKPVDMAALRSVLGASRAPEQRLA